MGEGFHSYEPEKDYLLPPSLAALARSTSFFFFQHINDEEPASINNRTGS